MRIDVDIAVIGAGFGGSLISLVARRLGYSVALLERGRHPRFAIGESSTPLADLLWADLARRYDLPRLLPLSKWGSWQRAHPEISCGLKRGFTFLHHRFGQPFADGALHRRQLLVAASLNDEVSDTHWYRAEFDHFLAREAQAAGADYYDQTAVDAIELGANRATIHARLTRRSMTIRTRLVLDASGPHGCLHRLLGLPNAPLLHLPPTQALYSHFTDVARCETLGFWRGSPPRPYPPDDAALHHVFDGGWMWVLRFNNGVTSAGLAATDRLAARLKLADGLKAWQRLMECLPSVREQFAQANLRFPLIHTPRLAFRSGRVAGPNWALLPFAAGFIDPLLSTGFPLTLLGIARLAEALERGLTMPTLEQQLAAYARATDAELMAAEHLVAALYAAMGDFPVFIDLTFLYFAAASYAEAVRRAKQPELATGFLLHNHAQFGPACRGCCNLVLDGAGGGGLPAPVRRRLHAQVCRAIASFDRIGLSASGKRNWYPCTPTS